MQSEYEKILSGWHPISVWRILNRVSLEATARILSRYMTAPVSQTQLGRYLRKEKATPQEIWQAFANLKESWKRLSK